MESEKRTFRLGSEEDKMLRLLSKRLGKSTAYIVNLAIRMAYDVNQENYVFAELEEKVRKDFQEWMTDHTDLSQEQIINKSIDWYLHDHWRKYLWAEKIETEKQD